MTFSGNDLRVSLQDLANSKEKLNLLKDCLEELHFNLEVLLEDSPEISRLDYEEVEFKHGRLYGQAKISN